MTMRNILTAGRQAGRQAGIAELSESLPLFHALKSNKMRK